MVELFILIVYSAAYMLLMGVVGIMLEKYIHKLISKGDDKSDEI